MQRRRLRVDIGARSRRQQRIVLMEPRLGALNGIVFEQDFVEKAICQLVELGVTLLREAHAGQQEHPDNSRELHGDDYSDDSRDLDINISASIYVERARHPNGPTKVRPVQGTLDVLILKIVALEPMHGYGIAQRIRQISGVLQVQQGSLYPALHRLEKRGWLRASGATPRRAARRSSIR